MNALQTWKPAVVEGRSPSPDRGFAGAGWVARNGAAAVAAALHGYAPAGEPISVISHGGELQIRWTEAGAVEMTGPAEFVFEGAFYLDS